MTYVNKVLPAFISISEGLKPSSIPIAENQTQIVDTYETAETFAVTRLQRRDYQINLTLLM